jgi:glycerol-3-phosphate acyltransferase PlsY
MLRRYILFILLIPVFVVVIIIVVFVIVIIITTITSTIMTTITMTMTITFTRTLPSSPGLSTLWCGVQILVAIVLAYLLLWRREKKGGKLSRSNSPYVLNHSI